MYKNNTENKMLIKLKCLNEVCEYCIEVSEKELIDNSQYYERCLLCNSKLKITKESLNEIIKKDLETQVKENVDKWFRGFGIETTIEICERNKDLAVYRLYKAEIEKRGFKIK